MRKNYIKIALMLAALAGVFACGHQDPETPDPEPEPQPEETEEMKERTAVNTFAYNVMDTYYLWNKEIESGLKSWKMNDEPIKKVKEVRYKDSSGKDIDKWTVLTDDIESMISSTGGVSTTYGLDFKLYWYDQSQNTVCMVVTLVYPDSPAAKAGLKRGDVITKIAGTIITGTNYGDLVYDEFYYAKSSTLSDMYGKDYSMTAVEMYEDPVLVQKVFDLGGKKVGYLFFNSFTLTSCIKLAEAGRYFKSEGIESLILDMRYNGGGYVLTETLLASMLAPEADVKAGSIFETSVYNSTIAKAWGDDETHFAQSFTVTQGDEKITIDISDANMGISHLYAIMTGSSASASESLLVGLMPYLDVKIFGQQSYGKYCSGIMYSAKDWYKDYDEALKKDQRELGKKYANKWGIYVMIGRYADKYGKTPCMPDGFTPDFLVEDRPDEPYQLGEEHEAMLAAVLSYIQGGVTVPQSAARSAAASAMTFGPEIERDRGPAWGAHILLPQDKSL